MEPDPLPSLAAWLEAWRPAAPFRLDACTAVDDPAKCRAWYLVLCRGARGQVRRALLDRLPRLRAAAERAVATAKEAA